MIYESSPENIIAAATELKNGNLVGMPTETVYGLAADAFNEEAVSRIYSLKGRPSFNPLIAHVGSLEDAAIFAKTSSCAEKLASDFWPGPLTIVLPLKVNAPLASSVTAGLETVAVRSPAHPIAQKLIAAAEAPLAAPSANRSGEVSPTTAEHVADSFGESLPVVLDGGPSQVGLESTILSLAEETPTILRPGAITRTMLEEALDEKVVYHKKNGEILSPGMLLKHYSPRTPLVFSDNISSAKKERRALIRLARSEKSMGEGFEKVSYLSSSGDLEEVAQNLFSTLRALDKENYDLIAIDGCSETGMGRAIMDRLIRATAK